MKDQRKTKLQLIEELEFLRQKVRDLEMKNEKLRKQNANCIPIPLESPVEKTAGIHIELVADFNVIEARRLNISEAGICFETDEDLSFEIHFEREGQMYYHRGHLVWLERIPEGGYRFGLMFSRHKSYQYA